MIKFCIPKVLRLPRHWYAYDDEALLSINLASHGQLVKILITIESHDIPVFSLNFAYLYILSLYSVYQLKLNNNGQQELCRSKQSDFFYKSQ